MWKVVYNSDLVLTNICIKQLLHPWWYSEHRDPKSLHLSLLSLSSLLSQTKDCSCHFQVSSTLLTRDGMCTRKMANSVLEARALFPLICKVFQVHLECLREIDLLISVQAWWTPAHPI